MKTRSTPLVLVRGGKVPFKAAIGLATPRETENDRSDPRSNKADKGTRRETNIRERFIQDRANYLTPSQSGFDNVSDVLLPSVGLSILDSRSLALVVKLKESIGHS